MKLINYKSFFTAVMNGDIELTNDRDATIFTSYKAGGQEFTLFGKNNTKANLHQDDVEAVIYLFTNNEIYTNRQVINNAILFNGKKDMIKYALHCMVEETVDELC